MPTENIRGLRSKIIIYDDCLFDEEYNSSFITLPIKQEEYKGVYDVQDN